MLNQEGLVGLCGLRGQDDPGVRREPEESRLDEMTFYDSRRQQMFAECLPYVRFSSIFQE